MSTPARFRDFLDQLPVLFIILGVICLLGAAGVFLVLGRLDRIVIVLAAVGIGLLVYAALERPERTTQALTSRNVRYGSNSVIMSVAFVAILGLLNVLANRYSNRLDLTQNQIYTLSPLSIQITQELKQPVHAIAFYRTGDTGRESLEDVFKEYVRYTGSFTYEFVDPQLQPGLARQYQVQFPGTTVLVSGSKQQTVTGSDEGSITSALLKLERDKKDVAYYLTGHGELDFTDSTDNGAATAKTALEAQNFDVRPLNLGTSGKVPADAALVIVAGPTAPILPAEVTAIESYLDNGGKAVFFVDKRQRPILEPLAEHFGVQIGDGFVVDPAQSLMNDPLTPLITRYQSSPVTKDLPETLFQAATTVTPMKTPPAEFSVQPLAQTTEASWLNTDAKVVHYQPGVDVMGPLTVAVDVTKNLTQPGATPTPTGTSATRIVFVGDVAFATNAMLQFAPGNKTLLTNVADWLSSNEDLIQIQAKSPTDQTLTLSNTQLNVLLYGSAVFLPLIVIGGGLFVWWKRR
jgi:ABC-type uncharacterized transport system involved in gliding motility auxiliary subunit